MSCSIFHNPSCSKSRETLALLENRGVHPEVILYLETPPNAKTLDDVLKKLGKEPLEMMRTKETAFKKLGLSKKDTRSRTEWIQLMVDNPVLIERPIVIKGSKAALGRPPIDVLKIF